MTSLAVISLSAFSNLFVFFAFSLAACLAVVALVSTAKEIVAILGITMIVALPMTSMVDGVGFSVA